MNYFRKKKIRLNFIFASGVTRQTHKQTNKKKKKKKSKLQLEQKLNPLFVKCLIGHRMLSEDAREPY